VGVLGVFQKLISVKADEMYAFDLLKAVIQFIAEDALQPHLRSIFQILLMRLQHGQSPRYVRLITAFFAQYIGKLGAQQYFDTMNSIQPGLGLMILSQVWLPRLKTDVPVRTEAKVQVIGLTHIICHVPNMLNDPNFGQCWSQMLCCLVQMISSRNTKFDADTVDEDDVVEIGYDPTFCRLHFAVKAPLDPFPDIKDPISYFSRSLYTLCSSQPGKYTSLILSGLEQDSKLSLALETIMKRSVLQLI
jgi:exportin-2 (importin alpha re-exporter)